MLGINVPDDTGFFGASKTLQKTHRLRCHWSGNAENP